MSKKGLINYFLFQRRRKFNPLNLFKKNNKLTYEEFVSFLNKKMIDSPGKEYFDKLKEKFDSLNKKEEPEVKEEKVVENKQVKIEEVKLPPVKPKRKKHKKQESKKELSDEKSTDE